MVLCILCIWLVLYLQPFFSPVSSTSILPEAAAEIEASYPEITNEELVQHASLIVLGSITKSSDPFGIRPVFGGDPVNYYDWTVIIESTYRGEAASNTITVRTPADFGERLQAGSSALMFLYQPGMGGGYNTEGDYYYIYGRDLGLYYLTDAQTPCRVYNMAGTTKTWDSFMDEIAGLSAQYPVNEKLEYEAALENLKTNLETGFITQAEYDNYLAELQVYAEIVPADASAPVPAV